MTPRKVSLLLVALAIAVVGVGNAFAGDKAGSVNATGSSDCAYPGSQQNAFSGEVYVWLHDPNQADAYVTLTYQKTKDVDEGTLVFLCTTDGWTLYDTGIYATGSGAATVEVYDVTTGAKIGGDSFRVVGN